MQKIEGDPTEEQVREVLQENKFREWLKDKPDEGLMGLGEDYCVTCPLALYLEEFFIHKISISYYSFGIHPMSGPSLLYELPKWCISFVDRIDGVTAKCEISRWSNLTWKNIKEALG